MTVDSMHDVPMEAQLLEGQPMEDQPPEGSPMTVATLEEVDETNHKIYDPRLRLADPPGLFSQNPYAIYFYYLKFEDDNRPSVRHYFWGDGPLDNRGAFNPIALNKVEAVVELLAQNARDGGHSPAPDAAKNFNDIKWRGISYIAILLDEGSWNLDSRGPRTGAIKFQREDGAEVNHSFFDGLNIVVNIFNRVTGQHEPRTAILFINHFKKNVDGDPVAVFADSQTFKFDVFSLVKYYGEDRTVKVILDPGGTNQGPALFP